MSGYAVFSWVGASVHCRRCSRLATLDTPFEFYLARKGLPASETRLAYHWNGWLVVEKHPLIAKWVAPDDGQSYERPLGVALCSSCYAKYAYEVSWLADAYYQWDIRGHTLWAYNRDHARVLLEFIGGKERDDMRYPRYTQSLRKLPTEFIKAKVRDDIIKAISRTLEVYQS